MSPPPSSWRLLPRNDPRIKAAGEVDPALARAEWLALARAIEGLGGRIAVQPPRDALVGMPFASEAGHPLPPKSPGAKRRFLLPRMKQEHRQPERDVWAEFVTRLGFEAIDVGAGLWEGQADVAKLGDRTFLFWGVRTDREGAEAAREHFEGETLLVELWEPAHHGNIALLPLGGTHSVLVCADVVDDDSLANLEARCGRDRVHFTSEDEMHHHAMNLVVIGDTVLAPEVLQPRVRKILDKHGLTIVDLELSELCDKAHGASRRFVCRVEDADDIVVPPDLTLEAYVAASS